MSLKPAPCTRTSLAVSIVWVKRKSVYRALDYASYRCDVSAVRVVISIPPNSLGFVIMIHSYDNMSLLVSLFDIPVSLDHLLQRIASIYDRFYLSCFNKLFEEDQVFRLYLASGILVDVKIYPPLLQGLFSP